MDERLHERTIIALARAAISPMLCDEDLSLICWHCGVQVNELNGVKVSGYKMSDVSKWPMETNNETD